MTDTLCYFTTFVCHYDQLLLVAKRYQERLAQIAALPGHAIVLAAEEVCDLGRESLIFDLLIKEILDEPWTAEEAESYSTFMLTTIIDLPDDGTDDPVWDVIDLLGSLFKGWLVEHYLSHYVNRPSSCVSGEP